jgi:superfamily I DNA/RNA helicase/RecB family exonuclease
LHNRVTEAPTRAHTGASWSRRPPAPRYRLVRPAVAVAEPLSLGTEQRTVVVHRSGPLLVVGGPGTGKTTALVEAVAARVEEGVDPAHILVLTFGRRTASALRNRIEARIGRSGPGGVSMAEPVVRTFPAYAFGLLRIAATDRGELPPRLLTGSEQDAVIRDLLDDPDAAKRWPASLRRAVRTRAFAAELRDVLLRAAERGIGARTLADLGRRNGRPEWVAAASFLEEYVRVLALRDATTRGSVAYDQAELVRAAAALLVDDPDLLAAERDRCRHVYVDELADTDPAQIDLLGLVAGGGAHVVGFADPDSATFGFRGGDPTAVRDFAERFPTAAGDDAPRVVLPISYRSTPALVVASRRIAARLRGPAGHRAIAPADQSSADVATNGRASADAAINGRASADAAINGRASAEDTGMPALEVCTLRSVTSESAFIAQRLREAHLRHGVPWSRMAIIVRSLQHHHAALRRALTQAGVPVTTGADDTALATQPAVAPLLLLVRCAVDESMMDEEAALTLLHSSLGGADPFLERRLRQALRDTAARTGDRRSSGELLVEALLDRGVLALLDEQWSRPARAVAGLIAVARDVVARPSATAEDVLWSVWRASGLAEKWAALSARGGRRGATADRDLDAVLVLFDAAARFTDRLPGARIEVFLDHLLDQQLPADTLAPSADRGEAVRILTAHAAKGLEWDLVAVAGVQEGVWPDLRLRGSVLGSERLVDLAAGRDVTAASYVTSQVSAILDEERRLFYVAITRARRALVVTAVDPSTTGSGGEEQPSRFLAELVAEPTPAAAGRTADGAAEHADRDEDGAESGVRPGLLQRPLTLPALVAELRTTVTAADEPEFLRRAAATQLARLADAGVPGADPDEWWGLRRLSDERALVDADATVRVSPSTVEGVLRCGMRWLLERHGGSDPPTPKQGLGNLVHAAAMLADTTADLIDSDAVRAYVSDRFDQIELPARWLGQRERDRAERMVDKLLSWLSANPRQQLAIEKEFGSRLDRRGASPAVLIRGRVDRLERDDRGRLVVVDLKTGSGAPSAEDAVAHPQLAAYQVAIEAGAFEEGAVSGGAEIVAVGTTHAKAAVRVQPPLADADDPTWADALVREAATAMAAATFRAVVNDSCPYCAVRTSCPLSGKGRQVTG